MRKQLESTGRSRGGQATKTHNLQRQVHVEKFMRMGFGVTKIASMKINGRKLGALDTITKDIKIITSRWLEGDLEWFHRASVARIKATHRFEEQMVRLGDSILKLKKGKVDYKTLAYTESQLTTVLAKIYDTESDFDPEQYVNKKIQESVDVKIKKAETAIS